MGLRATSVTFGVGIYGMIPRICMLCNRENMQSTNCCVYCGSGGKLTEDHIPPKCIFPKPWGDLITVPACSTCNNDASKDDEYFRSRLVLREDAPNIVKPVYDSTLRSLSRPQAKGFSAEFFGSIFEVGENSGGYDLNLDRLTNVTSRVIKGLFYFHYQRVIPSEFLVRSYSMGGFQAPNNEIQNMLNRMKGAPINYIRDDRIFNYYHILNEDDSYSSCWYLTFFGRSSFLGLIVR